MIEITGNHLLPKSDYLEFTKLNDSAQFDFLTLPVIKDRFEKHPYIAKVDVEYTGNNSVKVYLTEKNIEAVLLAGSEPQFISDDFHILPMLQDTKAQDIPVISNPQIEKSGALPSLFKTDGMVEAFKIIEAAKLTNENIYKRLSEINLRNGGDIILTISGIKPPVLFGKGEAAKKMVYLDIMWNGMNESSDLMKSSEYIDLRFANEIYVGTSDKTGLSE